MTPVISPNRFAIYLFCNKNRQITVVQLCNSETFVCEKCQCVHYDSVLALLVQMLDGPSTSNATFVTRLPQCRNECQVSTILQEFLQLVVPKNFSVLYISRKIAMLQPFINVDSPTSYRHLPFTMEIE